MSFYINAKKDIKDLPSEEETKLKFLSIAYNINCYNDVKKLFNKYEGLCKKHIANGPARVQLVEDLLYNLYTIDVRLVGWLIDENGKIMVEGRVVFELKDDSQMFGLY